MPEFKIKKINWPKVLRGTWQLTVAFTCILLHSIHWYIYTITFMPLILPLSIVLLSGWLAARWFRKWLTRLFEGTENIILHTACMVLLVSWIPLALLLDTNYLLAEKTVSSKTFPIKDYGQDINRSGSNGYAWVKIRWNWVNKKLWLFDKSIKPEAVDSVEIQFRTGYLGFNIIDPNGTRFLQH